MNEGGSVQDSEWLTSVPILRDLCASKTANE